MACVVACGDDGQSVWSDTGRAMWRKETHCAEVRGTRARKNTTVEYEQHKNKPGGFKDFENTFGLHFETLRVGGLVN